MCLEVGGDGLASLEVDERCAFSDLAMYTSATTCIMEPDDKVERFLSGRARRRYEPVFPDPDAHYQKRLVLDLNEVRPVLVPPPLAYKVVNLTSKVGMKVDVGYVGTCSSGRVEDFREVLEILDGKKIAEGFRLEMVPSSLGVQKELADSGIMGRLIDAGARFLFPCCDSCFGLICDMTPGEVALSTGMNVRGRKGCAEADIYMAGPYSIAAAALTGRVTDPRSLMKGAGNAS